MLRCSSRLAAMAVEKSLGGGPATLLGSLMASNPNSRPKGRSLRSLRTIWGFALRYPGHIAIAALALLVAAAATSGVPYAFKLIIDKGFATGSATGGIGRWFQYLLL